MKSYFSRVGATVPLAGDFGDMPNFFMTCSGRPPDAGDGGWPGVGVGVEVGLGLWN